MRPIESSLLGLLALTAFSLFALPTRRWRWLHVVPLVAVIVTAVHLFVEGYRWQMVPAYGLATIFLLTTARNMRFVRGTHTPVRSTGRKRWRVLRGILGLLAVAVSALLPVMFPHLVLPPPSGPFAIGTTNLYFVDHRRPETFTTDPNDRREISARVWYPAQVPADGATVSYCENAHEVSRILTRHTPFPSFLFDHLALVKAHSYRDAEVAEAEDRFPVVIFSHAHWAGISQSTVLMEDLASHGYVAVSIGHAYETPYFIQADGSIRPFDPRNEEFRRRGIERRQAIHLERELTLTRDRRRLESLIREISQARPKAVESVKIWAADIRSTIDELERINRGGGPLAGRLDMDRVAAIGHSFGGAAAGEACLTDKRCKAGINIDGLQLGDMMDVPLKRPFLFVHHDNAAALNKTPNVVFFEKAEAPAYLMVIKGSGHLSFCDLSLNGRLSVFRLVAPLGNIDGRRCHRVLNDYVLAFLDKHLRGRDSRFLDSKQSPYPEVEMSARLPVDNR